MNKEKQISEMANIIALKAFEQAHLIDGDENLADIVAEDLYEKGFRKQSDVAREIFEEIEKTAMSKIDTDLSIAVLNDTYYIEAIDELKKKYTESEDTE